MELESLNTLNDSMLRALLWAGELIALVISLLALLGFAIYLCGCARLCWTERRREERRRPWVAQPEPAESGCPVWRAERWDVETQLTPQKILLG